MRRAGKGHSQAAECKERDRSGHGHKPNEQDTLTDLKAREEPPNKSGHGNKSREREGLTLWGVPRDKSGNESKWVSEGHSRPGEHRGKNKSGYGKKWIE
jgi:hypothetical protein